MGSSGGGGGGGAGMMALMNQGKPMPGLPIAGAGASIDPYEYGKFQNFLPDIKAEGQNDMATGLRPDMFKYRSPSGVVEEGGGSGAAGGGDVAGQIQGLRDELAKLTAGGGGGQSIPGYSPFDNLSPGYGTNGMTVPQGGGVGTMGMGPGRGSAFYPNGQTPVPMQGRYGGTDQYGRGNFSSGPMPENLLNIPIGR